MKYLLIICLSVQIFAKNLANFNLSDYHTGKEVSLQKLLQSKKVVLNFWASWCTSCIKELAELEELKSQHKNNYHFVAINAGESDKKIKKFLKKYGFSYQILKDVDKAYSKSVGVLSLPQSFVVDRSGKIIFHEVFPPKEL